MKKIILWILIPFIAIQFIDMNIPQIIESKANHNIDAPKKVTDILERSCYDCHSNSLIYPWYSKIAPLSWYTQSHVKNGRRVVNFSIWKSYDKEKQLKVLKELPKSLLIRMPLPDYLWLHQEAKLSKEDKKILSTWAKELKEKI
ncbi:MAG TPA: cytochrome C [Sulfurovum sp.]|nr:cytochrome C [Sulfurovum sp.]HIM93692.1 cytochrome C [Campylobacterales bacterium]